MTPRTILTGLGAFGASVFALLTAAIVGETYFSRLSERSREHADPAPVPLPVADSDDAPALIEAPHVAEDRDGPVDTVPGAPGVSSPPTISASAEHVPADLLADARPGEGRAPDAFRPDPTAPVSLEWRESLRPATGPARGFAANEGDTVSQGSNPG